MTERLSEKYKMFNEVINISSASSGLSNAYSMAEGGGITFIVGAGTVAAAATATTPTITVRQSGDRSLATSATVAGLSTTLGPTVANTVTAVKSVLVSISSAATDGETLVLNGFTLTANGTASTVSTALAFGSTLGATAAGGLDARINSLASVINNSTLNRWFTATTQSTVAARIVVNDTANTSINLVSTGTIYTLTVEKQQVVINVKSEDLNSTSAYVGIGISTAATALNCAVAAITGEVRYKPPVVIGNHIKST